MADLCPPIPDMGLLYLLAYCTEVYLDFARWSILDVLIVYGCLWWWILESLRNFGQRYY